MKLPYERQKLVFYEFTGTRPGFDDIAHKIPEGMSLEHHTCAAELPSAVHRVLFPNGHSLLLHRMKRHLAQVVTLTLHDELIAYGWLQSWKPFRRLYRSISTSGTMIGPAWTSPGWRGRGFHSLMLSMRLNLATSSGRTLSFVEIDNHASRKGLTRTGFTEVATVELVRVAYILRYCRNVSAS